MEVELNDDQIDAAINQALGIYGTYKPIEKWATIDVIASQQKYDIPAGSFGRGIIEVYTPDKLRQPVSLDQFDVFKYHVQYPNLSPGDFMMERVWWKAIRATAGSEEDWQVQNHHDGSASIYINPIPSEGFTLTYIYVVDPTLAEVPPTDDDWIQDYTLAICKEILGRIRSKFKGVQGAEQAIDMDGEELRQEGSSERETMEEYLTGRGQVVGPIRG